MTSIIPTRCIANRRAGRALCLFFLVAAALPLFVLHRSPVDPSGSIPFFDPGELEQVSFAEHGAKTARSVAEPRSGFSGEVAPLFGLETEPLLAGAVVEKWNRAKAEIARELSAIDQCRANGNCPADAQKLIALSAEGAARIGRAKVGLINRAVDLAIRSASDEAQWGVADRWSAPLETIRSGRRDCEDYAIVKYFALLQAGIPADDVKIVIVKNVFPNEYHAVAAVHVDDQWLILDNRTLTLNSSVRPASAKTLARLFQACGLSGLS
jgi:predicted transglutaminase-like cysteine proteinase